MNNKKTNKDIFLMTDKQRKSYFIENMNKVEDMFEDNKEASDDIFFALNKWKQFLFSFADDKDKKIFVTLSLKYIQKNGQLSYQMIETLSLLYKFIDKQLQKEIFKVVIPVCYELIKENRGITTVTIFLKNTHKAYSEKQSQICKELMNKLKGHCDTDELMDSYTYTVKTCQRHFLPTKDAKILLLMAEFQTATSFLQPPLCLLSVATKLKEKNIDFDILDNRVFSYSTDQILNLTKQYPIIAISSSPLDQVQTYFLDHRHTIFSQLVNAIKERFPEKQIIVCGAHGSVRPDFVLRETKADMIVKGEYEFQLPELIECILSGEDAEKLPNLVIRKENDISYTKEDCSSMHPEEWCDNIIDYSLVQTDDYYGYQYINNTHLKKMNWSVVQATRGCPYECIFCYNFYTKKVRYKKIENLIIELKQMEKIGVKEFFFIDQTFTINREYIQNLCKAIIDNNIHLQWTCETRIELVDRTTLVSMKKAGCIGIWFGVESFDKQVLEINKKGYSDISYAQTIKMLDELDIDYRAFIMLGMVGDNEKTLKNTVDEIVKSKIHISKTIVKCKERFGTELYEKYVPEEEKKNFYCFEQLGLRSGGMATDISEAQYNQEISRLMLLNKN